MSIIKENMQWPPTDLLMIKMAEYSTWYSGDAERLANFYASYLTQNVQRLDHTLPNDEAFWGRQIKNQGEICVHVPIASDIAETSANFLFGEPPLVKLEKANEKNASESYKESQKELDKMLLENGFFRKLLEGAETCAAMGGVYYKIAWDEELSPYPIPVVVQADKAIPEFKFGILNAVTFWKTFEYDEKDNKVYRLLERYEVGKITNSLYLGTADRLGTKVELAAIKETEDMEEEIDVPAELFAVYVPNVLPNRLDRSSYLGRSDYSGIEGLMDSLDEAFSLWIRELALAQGRILIPESLIQNRNGRKNFNMDKMLYVELDMDPTVDKTITMNQFDIRADSFEKTTLNLLDRIITSAGYSPQSFGLKIEGRAESGNALSIRERKSFATKSKKEQYWQPAIRQLVKLMIIAFVEELGGSMDTDSDINVAFSDGITNNLNELANSVKLISDATAASTETKVRLLHPEWSDEFIEAEVKKIIDENGIVPGEPANNPDLSQLQNLDTGALNNE